MRCIDKKDCIILNTLQKNCRTSLTDLAKKVGLSIDSVKKRLFKMIQNNIFYPRIQIRPRGLGFSHIVDVKIKLTSHTKKDVEEFIEYLKKHPRVAEVFSVSGEWDISIVIISKDADDLGNVVAGITNKYGAMIASWIESTTLKAYKFETYDLYKLMEMNNGDQ